MTSATKKFVTFVVIALVAIAAILSSVYVFWVNGREEDGGSSATEISAAQINKTVIEKMGYKGIRELGNGEISGHFDVPEDGITQASVYIAESNASAMEIACFKLSSEDYEEKIKASVSEHITAKLKGFQESPKESEYIQNYELEFSQGYVFMVIGENADIATKVFLDMFDSNKK